MTMTDGRKGNGGARDGAGRKPGGRNKATLLAMDLRQQMLASAYSPVTIWQKNLEWLDAEDAKLGDALNQPLDFASMTAEQTAAINVARGQRLTIISKKSEVAAMAAPYVQPKTVPVDEPITVDITSVANAEDLVRATDNLTLAVATGEISPDEGAKVAAILETRRKSLELLEMEKRIAALEGKKR
jgi:hypothetical protein